MKRIIVAAERSYDIHVYPKRVRSAKQVQSWVLEATNLEDAKEFGYDVLGGLSLDEIFEDQKTDYRNTIDKIISKYNLGDEYEPIGLDIAKSEFTVKTNRG